MIDYLISGGYALFLWWFSTGLVLYLGGLAMHTFRPSLIAATVLLLLAVAGLFWSSSRQTPFAASLGFTSGLVIYAWQELSYYMGLVAGPRKISCPQDCGGWPHFGHAIQATLYHQLATLLGAVVVVLLCLEAPNRVGMWTYLLLWGMQLSAKLNVFLGVRNVNAEFLPTHMQYLRGFLKQRAMNLWFPFSIVLGTALTVWLTQLALRADTGGFAATGWTLLASLMALAVVEHWLLILPLSASAPWQWWLDQRAKGVAGLDGASEMGGMEAIDSNGCWLRSQEH